MLKKQEITCDVDKVILKNKIRLVKQNIEQLANQHEYYMGISAGDGNRATEIIEKKQSNLWEILNELQNNI